MVVIGISFQLCLLKSKKGITRNGNQTRISQYMAFFYPVSLIQNKLHSTIQNIQQIKAELRRYLFLLCASRKH